MQLKKILRCAFFDLDNTLYPKSSGLMQEIGRRINLFMIERLGVKQDEVGIKREAYFRSHGTTLNALRRYYQVDPDEYLDFVHDIPIGRYLEYDRELDLMLEELDMRKIVFTNADAGHARRVLSRLRILRHFESIIDIHFLEFVNKPDSRAYQKAIDLVAAHPEECVLLEDTTVNIQPAVDLGMTTVMVGNGGKADGAHYHIDRITQFGPLFQSLRCQMEG
jgi:putative hydrolase of the HAD superfamily